MTGLEQYEVRVIVRGAGKGGRPLRYVRRFVGLTVREAIQRLDSDEGEGCLPSGVLICGPYYLNRNEVSEDSGRVLRDGDVLSADDP